MTMMMKGTMTINFLVTALLVLLLPCSTVRMDTEPRVERDRRGRDCSALAPDGSRFELRVGVVLTPRDRNRGSHLAYQVSEIFTLLVY